VFVRVGQGVQARQPFLEDQVVRKPGSVGPGVADGDASADVAVLDCGGDQSARPTDDEPGQCPTQATGVDRCPGRVRRDGISATVAAAVVVDPADHRVDVLGDLLAAAGAADPGLECARAGFSVGQQDVLDQQVRVVRGL